MCAAINARARAKPNNSLLISQWGAPQGPYTPVQYDMHMRQLVPTRHQYHQTPVRYDPGMRMWAPVRQA